jgi:outer membrane cobalamin receptor
VQLFTRRGASGDWNATVGAGSHGSGDLAATAYLGDFSLFVDGRTTNGDRLHSDATRKGARLTWTRALDDRHLLTLAADHRNSDVEDGGLLTVEPLFQNDFENTTRQHAAANFEANDWSASLHASTKRAEGIRTILLFPPATADSARRTLHSGEFGGSMQLALGTVRAGVDVARQRFDVAYSTTSTEVHRDVFAAYATQHLPLGEKLTLVSGIRADSVGGDRAFSPRVALHANVAGAALYLGAASGFKTASLEQLYDVRPLHAFGQTFRLANADLVPQRARSLEAGVSRRERFGLWQLDAYRIRVAHEIDFDPRTFRYGNISRSEHRGVEAAFEPNAGARIEPRLTYTWMRVYSLDDPQRAQLKNIPEHSATAMLTARLPLSISATALYTWNGRRWFDDAESIAAPDTNDLSFRLAWHALRLDLLNATDAHNATYGFALADFRGQLHSYSYPGARRAVRVSIDVTSRRSPRE